ncbi:hypothetical protein [Campylobacter sp. RM16192]|uniref:hypothetical protein n=1 Tax=Campylobacter sp. RM16192 TaxID=1660080 RepID=UPI001554DCCE|nr:hypothetical protein [Campylobacter sp. RM16192]
MDKVKCPLRELKEKQGGLLKYLNKLDNFVDDAFEKVEGGYDKFANWADENIPYAGKVLDVRKFGKEVDELLQTYTRTRAAIYAQAKQFKEHFGNLSVSDRKILFRALDGELGKDGLEELAGESVVATEKIVESLPEHLRGLYTKVRQAIDNGANALVEAGALDKDNVITHYIKHYYKKHLEEAQGNAKIAKALSQSKFFKRKDLTWEQKQLLEIEDDAAFAITNTILEQKLQLQKANLLKEFADKFAIDESEFIALKTGEPRARGLQRGAGDEITARKDGLGSSADVEYVRVSDESVGGGVKKYGALAGKYVPKEIHTALKEAEVFGREMARYNHFYYKIIDHIKVNVTVKNPFTHAYNFVSNMSLAFLHGDFLESMKMFGKAMSRDGEFKKWEKFADSLGLDSHLNDLEGVIKPLKGDVQKGKLRKIGEFLYMTEGSKSGDFARRLYALEDKIFKIARFKKNLEAIAKDRGFNVNDFKKFSPDELAAAMKDAQYHYVDYSTHFNGTLKLADKSGVMPFIHYSVKATPMVLKAAMKKPHRFLMMQAVMAGLGASAWLGDNEKENLAKPKWAESGVLPNIFGLKSWTRVGSTGWYFNSGRLMPGFRFDGFDKLEFTGGFVMGAGNIILAGNSTLGYSLEGEDDTMLERIFSRSGELVKSYFPPITLGRYARQLGEQAIADITGLDIAPKDYNKEDLGYGGILLRGVGVRRFDPEKEYKKEVNKVKREYAKLVPARVPDSKDKDKMRKAKAHNEKLAKMDKSKLEEKKRELERKFKLYKDVAKKDGVKLDIELLRREKAGGFGGADPFKSLKFGS